MSSSARRPESDDTEGTAEFAHPQMIIRLGVTSQATASIRRPVGDVLL
jgi:hypothetical protein